MSSDFPQETGEGLLYKDTKILSYHQINHKDILSKRDKKRQKATIRDNKRQIGTLRLGEVLSLHQNQLVVDS